MLVGTFACRGSRGSGGRTGNSSLESRFHSCRCLLDLLELVKADLGLEALDENLHALLFRERILPIFLHGAPHFSLVEVGLLEPTGTRYSPLGKEVGSVSPHTVETVPVGLPGLRTLHRVVTHKELCLESESLRTFCLIEERLRTRLVRAYDNELHAHGKSGFTRNRSSN